MLLLTNSKQMNFLKSFFSFSVLILSIYSCGNNRSPIQKDAVVTVTNTFQSTAFTMDEEVAIEDLFMAPAGSLAATATISEDVEFPAYLLNLYDIDIDRNSIEFTVVAQENDPTYGELFRVLEANTFDRYYFTFDEAQNVREGNSNNSSVNFKTIEDNVFVVEITEGYDFKPGQNFKISLD